TLTTCADSPYPYEHLRKTEPACREIDEVTLTMCAHSPYPYEYLRKTELACCEIDEVTTGASLSTNILPPYTSSPLEAISGGEDIWWLAASRMGWRGDVAAVQADSVDGNNSPFLCARSPTIGNGGADQPYLMVGKPHGWPCWGWDGAEMWLWCQSKNSGHCHIGWPVGVLVKGGRIYPGGGLPSKELAGMIGPYASGDWFELKRELPAKA
ncbi:hypothetical protein EE612_043548, partial [Oryza sativa]